MAILTEDLPDIESDLTRLTALSRYELIEFHQEHGHFVPDRAVQGIIRETANAVRYLASHPDLAELSRPADLRAGSVSKESAPESGDPEIEARDKWVHDQAKNNRHKSWNDIRKELMTMPFKSNRITTVGGIRKIAIMYARRHGLAKLPLRKPGRRPGK